MKTDDIANTVYIAANIIHSNVEASDLTTEVIRSHVRFVPRMVRDVESNIGLLLADSPWRSMNHVGIKRAFGTIMFRIFDACKSSR